MAVIDEQDGSVQFCYIENSLFILSNSYIYIEEVLDRIDNGLRTIDVEMKETEHDMIEMDKCCGLCVMPWQRLAYHIFKICKNYHFFSR